MTADTETIREALNDWVPEGEGYVMDGRFRPHLVEALAALGRVEERERALMEALEEIVDALEPLTTVVRREVAAIARAALAGSVAAGSGEE